MNEEKKLQIRGIVEQEYDNHPDQAELAKSIMEGFIWGKYAKNEHYNIDDIIAIIHEFELETQAENEEITDNTDPDVIG
jgi:hypothetical protein